MKNFISKRIKTMPVLRLIPACKDYLWGGHRLKDEYGIDYDGDIYALC